MQWVCEIQQRTHMRTHQMDGDVPLENLTGETEDISDYLYFGFYDQTRFHENAGLGEQGLGRSEISENQLMFSEFEEKIKYCIKDDDFPVD